MKEKIKNWLAKNGLYSPDDKKEIKAAVKDAGLSHTFKSGCPDCYTDAVTLLAVHYGVREANPVSTASGKYRYLLSSPTMWNGHVRLDADTPDFFVELFRKECPTMWAGVYEEVITTEKE